jgi:hypothetical protein
MAIWQWDVWIVPRKEVAKRFDVIPDYMELDWFESIEWWNSVSKNDLIGFFSSILPDYYTPWAENTQSWGSDDGDRIQFMVEDGKITDVVIRVDLRYLNINFLHSLVNFADGHDFLFFPLESKRFIEPDLSYLLKEIRKSRKITFLHDPEKFFSDEKYLNSINKENRRRINKDD